MTFRNCTFSMVWESWGGGQQVFVPLFSLSSVYLIHWIKFVHHNIKKCCKLWNYLTNLFGLLNLSQFKQFKEYFFKWWFDLQPNIRERNRIIKRDRAALDVLYKIKSINRYSHFCHQICVSREFSSKKPFTCSRTTLCQMYRALERLTLKGLKAEISTVRLFK
jgi:hypothetical protein